MGGYEYLRFAEAMLLPDAVEAIGNLIEPENKSCSLSVRFRRHNNRSATFTSPNEAILKCYQHRQDHYHDLRSEHLTHASAVIVSRWMKFQSASLKHYQGRVAQRSKSTAITVTKLGLHTW